jgi:hypothetical protein
MISSNILYCGIFTGIQVGLSMLLERKLKLGSEESLKTFWEIPVLMSNG